jgi:hypothetical protein
LSLHRVPLLHVSAAAVAASLSLALVGTVPVYAADPDNPGHHYGQLKNGNQGHHYGQLKQHPPGPVPSPNPVPNPVPKPIYLPVPNPVITNLTKGAGKIVEVPALDPTPAVDQPATQTAAATPQPVPDDPLWWMVLTILPCLAVLLVIGLRGLVARVGPRLGLARMPVAAAEGTA